ncbi:ornithine cyclodeaminase family protein [Streptomyces sp. NEAU-S77]|uniref:ornithine cyclodeaminase family protein n=1 Tax=Streptomyces sp. NEAU-S77 TaxID=3411033 RepID=UPI003BA10EC7
MKIIDAASVAAALPMRAAIRALQQALRDGLDPEADPPRAVVPVDHGQLLLMPAEGRSPRGRAYAGVKMATVAPDNPARGLPRIQGQYLLLDAEPLTPLALLDGVALTNLRTAAVSAAAADLLAPPDASRLVLFGGGPQAHSHLAALRAIRPLTEVTVVGRTPERARQLVEGFPETAGVRVVAGEPDAVADADLIACCTTARTPLFDGTLLPPHATVLAVGSHEPGAREVDDHTVRHATVVVESRAAATREAGDLIQVIDRGLLDPAQLLPLADLIRTTPGGPAAASGRPRLFKSVGMAWEDLVIAGTVHEAHEAGLSGESGEGDR